MSNASVPARTARYVVLIVIGLVTLFLVACGDDETTPTTGGEETTKESPAPSPTEEPETAEPTPTEEAAEEGRSEEIQALVDELESCLNDGGIKTKSDPDDFPTYGEEATIDLTFKYGALTVPGAVTLYVYASEEAAAKGKKQIDKNLLEGDSKTLLRGQVVVDDFGTTLQEPEAAEQAEVVESCTSS